MPSLKLLRGAAVSIVVVLSACGGSSDAQAARDLAGTVRVQGYRKVDTTYKAESVALYYVGEPRVNLSHAVTARNWIPGPPDQTELGSYTWVASGPANTRDHRCDVSVSVLRPENAAVAVELDDKQQQAIRAGQLAYIEVDCYCVGAP